MDANLSNLVVALATATPEWEISNRLGLWFFVVKAPGISHLCLIPSNPPKGAIRNEAHVAGEDHNGERRIHIPDILYQIAPISS